MLSCLGVTHTPLSGRSRRTSLPGWASVILTLAGHWFPAWGEYRLVDAQGKFPHSCICQPALPVFGLQRALMSSHGP